MTRLGQAGFELGDVAAPQYGTTGLGTSGSPTVSLVTGTPTPRSGTYCLKCNFGDPTNSAQGAVLWAARKTFAHASKTEMWYAFGFYCHRAQETGTLPGINFFRAMDTAGNVNIILFVDAGIIRAYIATTGGADPSTIGNLTLIGTASSSMSYDTWHLIEIRIVAATGATGNFELYLDGSSVISLSSQRTCQSNANLGAFALEMNNQTVGASALDGINYHAFDDVRWQDTAGSVNNGRPGDESIKIMVPTSAGDSTQWTPSTGSNYAAVDEIPPNTTDYVSDSTTNHLDLYNTTDFAITSISAINVIAYAQNPDGGGGSIYLPTKTGAGQSDGSSQALTPTWTYYNRLLEADPADSGAWSSAKLAALQIGVKVA